MSGSEAPDGAGAAFERLLAIMDRLRSPGGCAWDGRQSHASLVKHLIEESYEVVEAVEAPGGPEAHRDELVEELGDVLLERLERVAGSALQRRLGGKWCTCAGGIVLNIGWIRGGLFIRA